MKIIKYGIFTSEDFIKWQLLKKRELISVSPLVNGFNGNISEKGDMGMQSQISVFVTYWEEEIEKETNEEDAFIKKIISTPIPEYNTSDVFTFRFNDGGIYEGHKTPDISYKHFMKYLFKTGASDSEYEKYCRENKMKEITDFNSYTVLDDLLLVLEDGFRQRRIIFKAIYDSNEEGL